MLTIEDKFIHTRWVENGESAASIAGCLGIGLQTVYDVGWGGWCKFYADQAVWEIAGERKTDF